MTKMIEMDHDLMKSEMVGANSVQGLEWGNLLLFEPFEIFCKDALINISCTRESEGSEGI